MSRHNQHRNLDHLRGQTAAQEQETKEPPSPAASSSSSSSSSASSNSGSDEVDIQSGERKPQVPPPVPAVTKARKASPTRKPAVTTEPQTATEPETKEIEPACSSSSIANPTTSKEIMMEEPGRVTRAKLRKAISLQ